MYVNFAPIALLESAHPYANIGGFSGASPRLALPGGDDCLVLFGDVLGLSGLVGCCMFCVPVEIITMHHIFLVITVPSNRTAYKNHKNHTLEIRMLTCKLIDSLTVQYKVRLIKAIPLPTPSIVQIVYTE